MKSMLRDDPDRMAMLTGGQTKLDANKDGKISGEDFAMLREGKAIGGVASAFAKPITKMISSLLKKNKNKATDSIKVSDTQLEKIQKQIDEGADLTGTSAEEVADLATQMSQDANALKARGFNNNRIEELLEEAYTLGESKDLELALKEPVRIKKQEGGMMMDEQMEMLMEEQQVPDEEMEEDYLDFIINEALNPEEEDFLMEQLESNPQLSEVFDKVIEVASEFSGAGPVEGPGTEVSDSIPARLSDGEFVFTAKATEELGVDNLMSMMKDAEARADERLPAQEGGVVEEEEAVAPREPVQVQQDIRVTKETVGSQAAMQEEEDLVGDEIKKGMMSTRPYVRS